MPTSSVGIPLTNHRAVFSTDSMNRFYQQNTLCAVYCVRYFSNKFIKKRRIFPSLPGSRPRFSIATQIQYFLKKNQNTPRPSEHPPVMGKKCILTSTPVYSSSKFEIVHQESVKVYLHMYNGNVQQIPLCVIVVVVVFFTLTDRASTIPSYTRGCQSGTWSAGQKKIRGTSTKGFSFH